MKKHMKKPNKPTKKKKKKGTRKKAQTASPSNGVLKSGDGSAPAEQVIKPKPYQGPQKKELEKKVRDKGSSVNYLQMAGQFLRECKIELKKVKWPTRKELLASTAVVIVLVLLVSLFLGLIDVGLFRIIRIIVG
jgi:preprotein translocase subunit SecE